MFGVGDVGFGIAAKGRNGYSAQSWFSNEMKCTSFMKGRFSFLGYLWWIDVFLLVEESDEIVIGWGGEI